MKYAPRWLKSVTALTALALVTGSIISARRVNAAIADPSPSASGNKSIQIYVPPPERATNGICSDVLAPVINSIIDAPTFSGARWGVVVETLSPPQTLYSRNPDQLLVPASNIKLLTTAAALQTVNQQDWNAANALWDFIRVINLNSNNGYADSLLQRLGGPQSVQDILTSLGVDPGGYRQVDGSGLSRSNQAKPSALISVLKAMRFANGSDIFYSSLPVAGVSGTLRNRLRNTPAQGKIHAKTGTLNGVRALSGYMDHPDLGLMAFSVMVNQPNQSGETMVNAIDQVALQLSRVILCE